MKQAHKDCLKMWTIIAEMSSYPKGSPGSIKRIAVEEVRGKAHEIIIHSCFLCEEYLNYNRDDGDRCGRCPIALREGEDYACEHHTPYDDFQTACFSSDDDDEIRDAAEDFLKYLKEVLT